MKKILILLPLLCINACSSTLPGIKTMPDVHPGHELIQLSDIRKPITYSKNIFINIPQSITELDDDKFFNKGTIRLNPSKTIIISVPRGEKAALNIEKEPQQQKDHSIGYGSLGYFNKRETFIEDSLLRQGFDVVDRSRFEAKLRDMRDRATNDKNWWSYRDRLSEAQTKKISFLENERDSNRLSKDEANRQIMLVLGENKDQSSVTGKTKEGRREMSDISEVIRAAKADGDAKADYVLLVNYLDIVEPSQVNDNILTLYTIPEIKNLVNSDKDLSWGSIEKDATKTFNRVPRGITIPGYFAKLSAKLIEVSSGKIVWLGEHTVNSLSATDVQFELAINKSPANYHQQKRLLEIHNNKLNIAYSEMINSKQNLVDTYTKYMQPITVKSDQIEFLKRKKTSEINQAKFDYDRSLSEYKKMSENQSHGLTEVYDYDYKVNISLSSDLNYLKQKMYQLDKSGKEILNRHIEYLMTKVVQKLIKTIKVK